MPIRNIGRLGRMTERDRTPFGQRLRKARIDAGKTQVQVCEAIGIRQSTLSELETSASGSSYTPALARLYGKDAHFLATGKGQQTESSAGWSEAAEMGAFISKLIEAAGRLDATQRRELLEKASQMAQQGPGKTPAPAPKTGDVRGMSLFDELDDAPAPAPSKKTAGGKR